MEPSRYLDPIQNPYASPTTDSGYKPVADGSMEAIRRKYIKHETSVKSIGSLYLLGSILTILISIAVAIFLITAFANPRGHEIPPLPFVLLGPLLYLGLGLFQGAVGIAIRRLKNWSRIVVIIFSFFGLLGFPFGTLICGYILYLLLSKKSQYIFTDEYRHIVAATPHVKYKHRTSIVVWILLAFVLAFVTIVIFAALFNR